MRLLILQSPEVRNAYSALVQTLSVEDRGQKKDCVEHLSVD